VATPLYSQHLQVYRIQSLIILAC